MAMCPQWKLDRDWRAVVGGLSAWSQGSAIVVGEWGTTMGDGAKGGNGAAMGAWGTM